MEDEDDDFWSVAMLAPSINERRTISVNTGNSADDEDIISYDTIQKSFTILPPHEDDTPLMLNIQMNCNDGILSDVASSIWDAGLLLSGYLYGTKEGRQLCRSCFRNNTDEGGCGILELGSGLGIVGMAAAAAALSVHTGRQDDKADSSQSAKNICNIDDSSKLDIDKKEHNRVVLTDLNNDEILSQLRKNVNANLGTIAAVADSTTENFSITVVPCDWMDISMSLQTDTIIRERSNKQFRQSSFEKNNNNFPKGPFSLVLGSALVYLPEHAVACADTLFYYLTGCTSNNNDTSPAIKKQAIILQLPDRAGFSTHFLPRCKELGLSISCQELEPELVKRVQQGLKNRRIPSARDYRLYFISPK